MGKKKKLNKKQMAVIIEEILDYVPTDLKYSSKVENLLIDLTGHSFLTDEEEKQYRKIKNQKSFDDQRFDGIPGYIHAEDLTVWEAEKIMYESAGELTDEQRYPEAFNKEASMQYTIRKSA